MKKYITSILNDLKSWKQILLNRWHLHAPIALIGGAGLMYVLFGILNRTGIFFSIFAPSFLGGLVLFGFEMLQQGGRIIGEKERFESNKDLIVGEFFLIIGVVLTFLYLC